MPVHGVLKTQLLAAICIGSDAHAGSQLAFAEPEFLLPGHGLVAVEAADIDRDDDPDIVVLSIEEVITIFRNNGAGRFGPAETFAAPGGHLDFIVADLDGDQAPDLAVANFGDGTVSVLLNEGSGTFGPPTAFAAPGVSTARGLAAGDLDGDGDRDLLVGDAFNAAKTVLLNNGSGAFDQALPFTSGGTCIAIAIDDLDGDGDQDAITVFNGAWVHCNNGDGTFAPATALVVGDGHTSVAIADIDSDGDPDVAVSRSTTSAYVARVFFNNGGPCGGFTMVEMPISPLARDIALDDLNGDGLMDIATSHVSPVDRVSVLANLGGGTFAPAKVFFPGVYPQSLAIADFDADELNDIATANQFHNPRTVGLLMNKTEIVQPGDITGDGVVNINDLLSVLNAWGDCPSACPPPCPADIAPAPAGDCVVDINDLLLVINSWG